MRTFRVAAALGTLSLAVLALLGAGAADASFTGLSVNQGSSLVADALDAPGGLTATRSCTASAPQLRSVSTRAGTASTLSVPLPAGVVAGDVIVAVVVHSTMGTPPMAFGGDAWTVSLGGPQGVGGSSFLGSKVASIAEPAAYTFTGLTAGSATGAVVLAYSGGSWNYPSHSIYNGTGSTVVAAGGTVPEQTRLLTAFFADDYAGTISVPAGTTVRAQVVTGGADSVALLVTDRLVPVAGAVPPTVATLTEAHPNQGFTLPLQPGPGPGPVILTWTATPDLYATGYEGFRSDLPGDVVPWGDRTVTSRIDTTLGTAGATYQVRSYAASWRSGWVAASVPPC